MICMMLIDCNLISILYSNSLQFKHLVIRLNNQYLIMADEDIQSPNPLRFVYNNTPSTKILQGKSAIPPAFHYTPLQNTTLTPINYIPLHCSHCQAVMNPYCQINFNQKTVRCCICGTNVNLPPNYAQQIQPNKLPFQFMQQYTTMEYKSGQKLNNYRYSYLFIVDINIEEKQLAAIRQQMTKVVSNLPDYCNVGLITYGKNVHAYQLASRINTNFCINGQKEYTLVNVMDLLGVHINKNETLSQSSDIVKRFIVPVSQYRKIIVSRIKNLRPQNCIYVNERKHSCYGQALHVSICMSQASTISTRIVSMVGNPCTKGPGLTISSNFKEQMRSPEELSKGENIKYFASAKNYYDSFVKRVLGRQIILDIFIFTCNEIGFTQMSQLFINSGGFVVMHQEFRDRIFRQSFPKIFPQTNQTEDSHQLITVTQASVVIYCSKEVAINGALGQCCSLNKLKPFVSEKVIGKGKTHSWYLGSADQYKTLTIVYQTKQPQTKEQVLYFLYSSTISSSKQATEITRGEILTRVTTTKKEWSSHNASIIDGFDQEAAAVYLARQCVNKMLYEEQKNIRSWVDHTLVKWAQHYANYAKNDENSFSLPPQMKQLPQLVFHLRRSHFVNRFGISLDESFFKGHCMNRQSVQNCIAMIQPALVSYSLSNQSTEPVRVQLDQEEMRDDVILLLDTYFVVIQWYGQTVHSWQENRYHQMEQYEHIATLFNQPKIDIDAIMKSRFPVANFYHVHPYHSKQRYLKSRVSPKKTLGQQHQNMLTDDSDLRGFMQHLVRVVVKQG